MKVGLYQVYALGVVEGVLGSCGVGCRGAAEGVVHVFQPCHAIALFQDIYCAEVLQCHRGGNDVEVGAANLMDRQLIGVVAIIVFHALYIAKSLESEPYKHVEIGGEAVVDDFGLVDGGNLFGQRLEGVEVEITAVGVAVERYLVEVAAYICEFTIFDLKAESKTTQIVYPGTHDNETLYGWLKSLPKDLCPPVSVYPFAWPFLRSIVHRHKPGLL